MGHAPELVPNFTFFFQMGIFFVAFLFLNFLVFAPFQKLMDLREAKTAGLRERAAKEKTEGEALRQKYEALMIEDRKLISAWTETERRKISESERNTIGKARDEAAAFLGKARKEREEGLKEARRALSPLTVDFSSAIASKLMGHKVKVSSKEAENFESAEQTV